MDITSVSTIDINAVANVINENSIRYIELLPYKLYEYPELTVADFSIGLTITNSNNEPMDDRPIILELQIRIFFSLIFIDYICI